MSEEEKKDLGQVTLVDHAVVGFGVNMDEDECDSVRDTMLLAQNVVIARGLLAENQYKERYEQYNDVMVSLGWTPHRVGFERVKTEGVLLSLNNLVLKLISTVVTGIVGGEAGKALVNKVGLATMGFLNENPDKLKIFEHKTVSKDGRYIDVNMCAKVNGSIFFASVVVVLPNKDLKHDNLFVDFNMADEEVYHGYMLMSMSPRRLALIKDTVTPNIDEKMKSNVTHLLGEIKKGKRSAAADAGSTENPEPAENINATDGKPNE